MVCLSPITILQALPEPDLYWLLDLNDVALSVLNPPR